MGSTKTEDTGQQETFEQKLEELREIVQDFEDARPPKAANARRSPGFLGELLLNAPSKH